MSERIRGHGPDGRFAAADRAVVEIAVRRAAAVVARIEGADPDAVLRPRGRRMRRARHVAAYVAVVAADISGNAVAQVIGADPRAIRKALASVEDRRDIDPAFDRLVGRVERAFAA